MCVSYYITKADASDPTSLLNVLSAQRYLRCLSSVSTSQRAVKDPGMSMYYLCLLMVSCIIFVLLNLRLCVCKRQKMNPIWCSLR